MQRVKEGFIKASVKVEFLKNNYEKRAQPVNIA
jgi:hypothetical protein